MERLKAWFTGTFMEPVIIVHARSCGKEVAGT
jgi:hypothetical protein